MSASFDADSTHSTLVECEVCEADSALKPDACRPPSRDLTRRHRKNSLQSVYHDEAVGQQAQNR
ncbi:hypothetical protein Bpfe_004722, partial [Biomphalaria pfeifferi]